MNPNSRFLALKAQVLGTTQDHLQGFSIERKANMKSHQMTEQDVFWNWITPKIIETVTQTFVYHWSIEDLHLKDPKQHCKPSLCNSGRPFSEKEVNKFLVGQAVRLPVRFSMYLHEAIHVSKHACIPGQCSLSLRTTNNVEEKMHSALPTSTGILDPQDIVIICKSY
ncbi:hypothetical protein VNO77_33861 [Canavalia gladiata]|uniref:Uncharacterized protein n=1 Tax=Canavalia gladiata TaxID=3824 RepID=A0AAN9PY33_CANGL